MRSAIFAALLPLLLVSCGSQPPAEKVEAPPQHAPETFQVSFETTKGTFAVEVTRAWAPRGADRFHELVWKKFYDGARFYRVVPRFVVQFGIKGDPASDRYWSSSESNEHDAWSHDFGNDSIKENHKYHPYYVRAVRSF